MKPTARYKVSESFFNDSDRDFCCTCKIKCGLDAMIKGRCADFIENVIKKLRDKVSMDD